MFEGCFVFSEYVPTRGLWAPGSQRGRRVASAALGARGCVRAWPWLVAKLVVGLKLFRPPDSQKRWAPEAAAG